MRHIAEALAHGLGDALRHLADDKLAGLVVNLGLQWLTGGGS